MSEETKTEETKNEKFRRLGKFHSRIILKRIDRMKNLAGSVYESNEAERKYFIDLLDNKLEELRALYIGEPPVEEEEQFEDMPAPGDAPPIE